MNLYKTIFINGVEFMMFKIPGRKHKGINRFRWVFRYDGYLMYQDMSISDEFMDVIDNDDHPERDSLKPLIYDVLMKRGEYILDNYKKQSA